MTTKPNFDEVLKELEFEIEEGRGPRFLLAVCDDDEQAESVRMILGQRLQEAGKESIIIGAEVLTGGIVNLILSQSKSGNPAAVHLVQRKNSTAGAQEKLFGELNFQRDSISRLGIPIVIWIYSGQLSRLASRAPDLWSRRTATLYFDSSSIGALLERIFSGEEKAKSRKADEVASALHEILDAERGLNACLAERDSFSLGKTDSLIRKLRANIRKLSLQCSKGRRIDVTLWLWNAGQMDSAPMPPIKSVHGIAPSSQVDRNELLLALAEQTERLLNLYLAQLEKVIRTNSEISVLKLFVSHANRLWQRLIKDATQDAMLSLSSDTSDILTLNDRQDDWLENSIKSRAVERFELWLAGSVKNKPPHFSDQEAAILKYLYRRGDKAFMKAPLSTDKIAKMMPKLRDKVRQFLEELPVH